MVWIEDDEDDGGRGSEGRADEKSWDVGTVTRSKKEKVGWLVTDRKRRSYYRN